MMFPCPICKTEVPVKKAKSGKHFLRCDDCSVLMFINDEATVALMEAGIEDENPALSPGSSSVDSQLKTIISELKAQKAEIAKLKEPKVAAQRATPRKKVKAASRKPMTVGEYIRANV